MPDLVRDRGNTLSVIKVRNSPDKFKQFEKSSALRDQLADRKGMKFFIFAGLGQFLFQGF